MGVCVGNTKVKYEPHNEARFLFFFMAPSPGLEPGPAR